MNLEKPVVLLHADNFVERGKTTKPRENGRFQCLAAAELLRRNEISQVIIPGGVTTPGKPPVSEAMRDQILRNLAHRPGYEDRVVSLGTAGNTLEEIEHFKAEAQDHDWDNFFDIVPEGQLSRVKRIAHRKLGKNVAIHTSEEILTEKLKKGSLLAIMAQRAVDTHRQSRENRWVTNKFRILGMVEALPGGIPFIAWISKLLPDKGSAESTVPKWFK